MIRTTRNLLRLAGIGWTLLRFGAPRALDRFEQIPPPIDRLLARLERPGLPARPGERLAAGLEALGPTFVKLGQALSIRSDLLGEQITEDLARLQDKLPPFPAAQARRTIESQLQAPLQTLFRRFEPEAVAAGSIAQVHFAETPEGDAVAVKVLRPGVEGQFARDFALFYFMARLVDRLVPPARRLKPVKVVEIFEDSVLMEMDLRYEAAAASELAENFRAEPMFRVPRVDWARTARRVFTMERIHGLPSGDLAAITAHGHDPTAILDIAARVFFQQVFRDGFFHADMHPGNLFIDPDGALRPVDFGIMGRLDPASRRYLAEMLVGFLEGDYGRVADVHFRAGYVPAHKSRDAFAQACRSIGEPIQGRPLNEISVGKLLGQLFQITETFAMETQPQLLMLQKSMVLAEGMGRRLNPDINMWQLAHPLVAQWIVENLGPQARAARFLRDGLDSIERLPQIVAALEQGADRLAAGKVAIDAHSLAALARARRSHRPWLAWLVALAVALAWWLS